MPSGPIVLATRSAGKLRELVPMFLERGLAVVDLSQVAESADEEAVESFATFEENALAKARYFFERTGLPIVADDSGLEVAALQGAPGVRSKRWSDRRDLSGQRLDDENNRKLLDMLATRTSGAERAARYVCAAAFVDGRREVVRRGAVDGEITLEPRGCGGFGYDPYFLSFELGETFGEASRVAKERVSHRGRAFRALLDVLSPAVDVARD